MDIDIDNRSSTPTHIIEKVIRFVKPRGLKLPKIIIKNNRSLYYPFSADFNYGHYHEPYIIFRLGDHTDFPLSYSLSEIVKKRTGYKGEYCFPDKISMLCFVFGHEFKHAQQYGHPVKRYWLYHNRKAAESEADEYAFKKLNEYRELKTQGYTIHDF